MHCRRYDGSNTESGKGKRKGRMYEGCAEGHDLWLPCFGTFFNKMIWASTIDQLLLMHQT